MFQPTLLLLLVLSYLVGAIPFAVLVGKRLTGVNVQHVGSGNAGAMNTFRSVGRGAGVAVAVLDGLKAALAMLLGWLLLGPDAAALCGAVAVAGHCFSPFLMFGARETQGGGWKMALRRSGGKGLASGVVVLFLIDWRLLAVIITIFGLSKLLLRTDVTWPTIIAVGCTPLAIWWLRHDPVLALAVLLVCVVVIVKHLPDIREGFYVSDQPDA